MKRVSILYSKLRRKKGFRISQKSFSSEVRHEAFNLNLKERRTEKASTTVALNIKLNASILLSQNHQSASRPLAANKKLCALFHITSHKYHHFYTLLFIHGPRLQCTLNTAQK